MNLGKPSLHNFYQTKFGYFTKQKSLHIHFIFQPKTTLTLCNVHSFHTSASTQITLISNVETTDQVVRNRDQSAASINSQNFEELSLSDISLPSLSTTASQVPILPNPPTHEPSGRSSKKKSTFSHIKQKMKKSFAGK